jgi:hypothetical protein
MYQSGGSQRLKGARVRSRDPRNQAGMQLLLSLGRRRTELVCDLDRLRSPGKRYENLCLATAIGRTERRWLTAAVQSSGDDSADRCLIRGIELELLRLESSLERTRRWLLPSARQKARARAARRFQSITAEIKRELQSQAQAAPEAARAATVAEAAREADPGRCIALTQRGTRCRNRARADDLCELHARMASPALPVARSVGAAVVPTGAAETGPSQAGLRDRMRSPLPGWIGAARRAGVQLAGISLPRPAIPLRSLRGEVPRPALPRPALPHVNSSVGWAVAAPVALAVAFALVWTGVSGDDDAELGPPVASTGAPTTQAEVMALTDASQGDAKLTAPSGGAAAADRAKGGKGDGNSGAGDRSRDRGAAGPESSSAPAAPGGSDGSTLVTNPARAPGADPGTGSPAPAPSAPSPTPEPAPSPAPNPSPAPKPSPSPGPSDPPANPRPSENTLVGTVESVVGEVRGLLP